MDKEYPRTLLSSIKLDYRTPPELLKKLNEEFIRSDDSVFEGFVKSTIR